MLAEVHPLTLEKWAWFCWALRLEGFAVWMWPGMPQGRREATEAKKTRVWTDAEWVIWRKTHKFVKLYRSPDLEVKGKHETGKESERKTDSSNQTETKGGTNAAQGRRCGRRRLCLVT